MTAGVGPGVVPMLGLAAGLGLDPGRFLRADPIEARLLEAALERAAKFAQDRDEALAARIVNGLVEAWNKGQRKAR